MLVLTRKVGESIKIGPNTYITVVSVKGDKVRVGVTAPREIPIYRTELLTEEDGGSDVTVAQKPS